MRSPSRAAAPKVLPFRSGRAIQAAIIPERGAKGGGMTGETAPAVDRNKGFHPIW